MTARTLVISVAALLAISSACDDPMESSPDIIVENAASVSIDQVFIRDCPVKFWGDNRLDANEEIAPGERRAFDLDGSCFDVLVYFETDRMSDRHNIEVPTGDPAVWIVNHPAF